MNQNEKWNAPPKNPDEIYPAEGPPWRTSITNVIIQPPIVTYSIQQSQNGWMRSLGCRAHLLVLAWTPTTTRMKNAMRWTALRLNICLNWLSWLVPRSSGSCPICAKHTGGKQPRQMSEAAWKGYEIVLCTFLVSEPEDNDEWNCIQEGDSEWAEIVERPSIGLGELGWHKRGC